MLHSEFAEQTSESKINVRITGFCKDPAIRRAAKLAAGIGFRDPKALKLEHVKLVKNSESLEAESDHAFPELEFLGCAVASCIDDDFGLVACTVENG